MFIFQIEKYKEKKTQLNKYNELYFTLINIIFVSETKNFSNLKIINKHFFLAIYFSLLLWFLGEFKSTS